MLIIAYPFVVFIGLQHIEPRWLSCFLLVVIAIRLWLSKSLIAKMPWLPIAAVLGALALMFSILVNNQLGILMYPVVVNVSMLIAFAYSLYKKPTVIEVFARITEPELDEQGVRYTANVTKVWCLFFVVNGAISCYSALFLTTKAWTLYNGFISYIAIGIVFSVEWLIRQQVKKQKFV